MNIEELRRQYELLVGKYQFVDEQRHGLIKELEQAEKRIAELKSVLREIIVEARSTGSTSTIAELAERGLQHLCA